MNILVVDDDRFSRGMFFQMLNNIGKHEVSFLTNGHNAVAVLADPKHGFDLVFIDLQMPRITGDKVIEIIKDITATNFVVVSGVAKTFIPKGRHIQAVQKPFDFKVIEKIVNATEARIKAR